MGILFTLITKMRNLIFIVVFFIVSRTEPLNRINFPLFNKPISMLPTRRILKGRLVGDTRPYMVYLRAAMDMETRLNENHWLCGGVIINKRHILTSAACIEDVKLFYVIAGTHKWIPPEVTDNECIINGAKKAVWKCVPKTYSFDGTDFNNINWMMTDIAIAKVEDDFDFERRILGCDFIPQKIDINTRSKSLENSGTIASIAGWGSTKRFSNIDTDPREKAENSVDLLETDVIIISKKGCRNHWDPRYHNIIDNHMICTKDSLDFNIASNECTDNDTNCKILDDFDEDYFEVKSELPRRRMIEDPSVYIVHTADHRNYRKNLPLPSGGFCEVRSTRSRRACMKGLMTVEEAREVCKDRVKWWAVGLCLPRREIGVNNDHGGPLVVGQGKTAVVIGIMSACQTNVRSRKCFGPFLFTSVFKYWNIINFCSTTDMMLQCRELMKSSDVKFDEINYNWTGHPDGPPISNIPGQFFQRTYAQTPLYPIWSQLNSESNTSSSISSTSIQKSLQNLSGVSTIPENLLRSGSLQSQKELEFDKSDIYINVSKSIEEESPILQFSTKTVGPVSVSSSPSPILQRSPNPKGEVLNILNATDKVSTRKTRRDNRYFVFQQWQQRYQDYLKSKT